MSIASDIFARDGFEVFLLVDFLVDTGVVDEDEAPGGDELIAGVFFAF